MPCSIFRLYKLPKVRQIYHHDKKMLETNYCRKPWILLYCCFSMWMCYSSVYSFWTKFSLILLQVCIHYITLCFSTQKLLQYISSSLAQKDNKTRPPWMVHCVCKCVSFKILLCYVDIVCKQIVICRDTILQMNISIVEL